MEADKENGRYYVPARPERGMISSVWAGEAETTACVQRLRKTRLEVIVYMPEELTAGFDEPACFKHLLSNLNSKSAAPIPDEMPCAVGFSNGVTDYLSCAWSAP